MELEADDHDFCNEFITPFGMYLPELGESHLYMTESKITADFIVDVLEHFWVENKKRFEKVNTLLINSDNGPECHSRRTQFIKRICEFAQQYNLTVKLAYYPPYHSKYNPIERVWGGLEQHWNSSILESKETVMNFAQTFVWNKKQAIVHCWEKTYETGAKLSAKMMQRFESVIERIDEKIGKWFVTIKPEKVKVIFENG